MFTPKNDFVLLRRLDEKAGGTIVIPDSAQVKSNRGEVIAVGRGEIIDGKIVPLDIEVGEIVLFTKYGAQDIEIDGEDLVLVRGSEIYGGLGCGSSQDQSAESVLATSSAN